jgi:hypothetical protein
MKRLIFGIIIGLGLAASAEKAHAQTDELPTPKEPYITPVPDYGHWTVTFKNPKPQGSAPAPAAAATPGPAPAAPPAVPPPAPVSATTTAPPPPPASEGSPLTIETIKTGELRGVTLTFADGTTSQFTCQGTGSCRRRHKGHSSASLPPPRFPTPTTRPATS